MESKNELATGRPVHGVVTPIDKPLPPRPRIHNMRELKVFYGKQSGECWYDRYFDVDLKELSNLLGVSDEQLALYDQPPGTVQEQPPVAKHSPIRDTNKVIESPKGLPENAEVVAVDPSGKSTPKANPKKESSDEEPKKEAVPVDTSHPEEQKDTISVKEPEDKSKLESAQIPNQDASKVIETPNTEVMAVCSLDKSMPTGKSFEEEPKSKQPNDKQIGSEEAEKDHQPELKITSEMTTSKSIDETTNAPAPVTAQHENPKEKIHSESLKDNTRETETPKKELLVAKAGEKQQPKKSEGTPKANSEDSRKTPTSPTKPHSEEPSVVKLQSSMTAFNQKPETVGAPFENVQVQPSDEKVPHNASNMPLQKAIDTEQTEQPEMMVTATVPFELEPGLEALRLRDEPDKVDVVEPSMMKANDSQPETDQVEPIAKGSSQSSAGPPNKLDQYLKFYYHQEANLRSMQTCYGNEISACSTFQQNEPIKSESELIARQEMLMHKEDTFLEQMKEASSKQAGASAPTAALPNGPMARGSQAQQSQGLSIKAKAVIAVVTVVSFVIVAHMANII